MAFTTSNSNGMLDLGDLSAFAAAVPTATATAQQHGMVNLSDLGGGAGSTASIATKYALIGSSSSAASAISLDRHSEILTSSVKAITLASTLALESPSADERDFWALYRGLLEDAERTPSYGPHHVGINLTPLASGGGGDSDDATNDNTNKNNNSLFAPSRLWYITHYAFIQDLLMRNPKLRLVALLLRWLETTYSDANNTNNKNNNNTNSSSYRNYCFAGRAHTKAEVQLMREAIRCALRGGRMDEAIRIAEAADDGITACMIAAAQMKAHPEAWNASTAVVPLFGEYAHGDEPLEWGAACTNATVGHQQSNNSPCNTNSNTNNKPWTSNKDRIDHLSTLLDWSELSDVEADEGTIAAILSGNEAILSTVFAHTRRWQDELWVAARCGLVKIFTKAISANGEPIAAGAFRDRFEKYCPPTADWVATATNTLLESITTICAAHLEGGNSSSNNKPAIPSFAEELQLRLILQSVSASSNGAVGLVFAADPNATIAEGSSNNKQRAANVSMFTAVSIVSTRAFADRLILVNPQQRSTNNGTNERYTAALGEYCAALITASNQGIDLADGARRCCHLLFTIADTEQRAAAVAKIILAARGMWFAAFNATVAGAATTTSSAAATVGVTSPTSKAQTEQRRAFVAKKEQWLLQLVRRFNISRYTADNDAAFVKALLSALTDAVFGNAATSAAEKKTSSVLLLTADARAETQQWRMALWAEPRELARPFAAAADDSAAASAASASSSSPSSLLVSSVFAICADVRATVSTLWATSRQFKAITEVMGAYNAFIRPVVDRCESEGLFDGLLEGSSSSHSHSSSSSSSAASLAILRELAFWSYFATILSHWDGLSTVAVSAQGASKDKAYGQLQTYAAEEQRLREAILVQSTRALSLQDLIVSANPQCAGAILKCVELSINAAVVGVNFPTQDPKALPVICQQAREQVMLVHEAVSLSSQQDVNDLFAAYRMLRLDTGVRKLKNNVAAALA